MNANKRKATKRFSWEAPGDGKRILINGPWELGVEIDHDDVNHELVEQQANTLVEILEEHWPKQ